MRISIIKRLAAAFIIMQSYIQTKAQEFKAEQFVQTASIVLNGNIEKVFPLFGAMEEKKWDSDWHPTPVFPSSGNMEEGFIFQTPDHVPNSALLTWVVADYDPATYRVKYLITGPSRVAIIYVSCRVLNINHTEATITYRLTGLTEEGNRLSHHLIAGMFKHELRDWEKAINEYLTK